MSQAATLARQNAADPLTRFWGDDLAAADPAVAEAIANELDRQRTRIELIASENITSSIISAHHGERRLSPRKSSSWSASKPARESSITMPNEARVVST